MASLLDAGQSSQIGIPINWAVSKLNARPLAALACVIRQWWSVSKSGYGRVWSTSSTEI